ncbi:MAG: hypothetical protein GY896_03650 [Gammaproteobacteria bacterium]|nr:hypothetical protein [Gammaproteobacteria bacterium]
MNFFKNINKGTSAATLVKKGLVNEDTVTMKEIMNCIFLVADGTRETWKYVSKEAAAGMVLVILLKDTMLENYLNAAGWDLVLTFVKSNPKIAKDISQRTWAEINSYRVDGIAGSGYAV